MTKKPTPAVACALAVVVLGGTACSGAAPTATGPARATGSAPAAESALTASTTVEWPVTTCGTYSGKGCAPTSDRVDVTRPVFSHPTRITNPLFPISRLHSAVLLGKVDGKPFRSETTLLPGRHTVTVDGKPIEVLESQYTAYSGRRLEEVAVDRYAQADDGSVWYLGEDVFDYRNGAAAITEGTWLAGRDGPPAMIMPRDPKVGDAFRAENVTGVVFEEVTVEKLDQTMAGPRGRVRGVAVMRELHLDGTTSDKVFAPGYGEFFTASNGEVEALALAVPTDAIHEVVPPRLRFVSTSAWGVLENARLGDWEAAGPTTRRMTSAWQELTVKSYPQRVVTVMNHSLAALRTAVASKKVHAASQATVDVAQSALDLELLYRGDVEVDRFHLHAQQLRVHAAAKDAGGVAGEVAVLGWIRDRLAGSLSASTLATLDADLRAVRIASDASNLPAAADHAAQAAARLRHT